MNWMTLAATVFFATTCVLALALQTERNRSRNQDVIRASLEEQLTVARDRLNATTRELARKRAIMGKYMEDADAFVECNAELERRNEWLEQRRNVVLARWWRKPRGHRPLVTWQVRKAGGA